MQKILTVHEGAVHFGAVQKMGHGDSNPDIIKGRFPHIHGKALETDGLLVVDFLFYDPVV